MRTARITDTAVREAINIATDIDVCAAQDEEDRQMELEQIEQVLAEVDAELAAEAGIAASRRTRPFAQVEPARRAQRRTERDALALLHRNVLIAGMPGRGKSAATAAVLAELEAEAA